MKEMPAPSIPPCASAPSKKISILRGSKSIDYTECETCAHVGLFFDGTENNTEYDRPKLQHTNIARLLESYRHEPSKGFFRSYVPGVGTPFPAIGEYEKSERGASFGVGCQARVLYGLMFLLNAIHRRAVGTAQLTENEVYAVCTHSMAHQERYRSTIMSGRSIELERAMASRPRTVVRECFVDVFGFSRGAAEARVFCQWLTQSLSGGKLGGVRIRLRFLGIFDTVASAGFASAAKGAFSDNSDGHDGWASQENLVIPSSVENCVHMVAMHELRKNFPLDQIGGKNGLPPRCQEFAYPGSHSDVGGGYRPGELGVSVGTSTEHGDSLKLSQIPLNHMYDCAVAAGVPVNKKRAAPETYDPFAISSALQEAYDRFLEVSKMTPRRIHEWLQPYLIWRWQQRDNFSRLNHVQRASAEDRALLLEYNAIFVQDAKRIISHTTPTVAEQLISIITPPHEKLLERGRFQILDDEAPSIMRLVRGAGPLNPVLADFFDSYVHDSLAGFNLRVAEPTGYWRYRKGFVGLGASRIVSKESDNQNKIKNIA